MMWADTALHADKERIKTREEDPLLFRLLTSPLIDVASSSVIASSIRLIDSNHSSIHNNGPQRKSMGLDSSYGRYRGRPEKGGMGHRDCLIENAKSWRENV